MENDTELKRLELFVDKLLGKYNELKEQHLSLVKTLEERDAQCEELQNDLSGLKSEQSEVGERVASLIDRIELWESEDDSEKNQDEEQGKSQNEDQNDDQAGVQGNLFFAEADRT